MTVDQSTALSLILASLDSLNKLLDVNAIDAVKFRDRMIFVEDEEQPGKIVFEIELHRSILG